MTDAKAEAVRFSRARAESAQPLGLSRIELAVAVLRYRWVIAWTPLATFAIVVGLALGGGKTYTSTAMFYPQQSSGLSSRLAGVASQFGLSLPGQDPSLSPDMFSQLAVSPRVLSAVVSRAYQVPADSNCPCTLVQYWQFDSYAPDVAVEKTAGMLRRNMSAVPGLQTGAVTLAVTTNAAALSQQVAAAVLAEVSLVNDSVRAVQAGAERRFVQGRLAVAESALAVAESRMQRFLELNRQYQGSPALTFEWQRLSRDVSLRQELFGNLAQEYENLGIEEVRNTPAIAVPQPPTLPALPDRRWLFLKGMAGLLLGLLVAVAYALFRTQLAAGPDDQYAWADEFQALLADSRHDVQRLWRRAQWLRRIFGGRP